MKKNILFVAIVSALASLFTSCDRKADFQSESFVTFESVSFSVSEADGKLSIPVSIFNPIDKAVNIIIRVNSDTAVEDEDFKIVSPANKVLTFAPGETSKNIEIELIHDKEMTGSKYFEIAIESPDPSFTVGNHNTASCKIKDKEHPLEMFIGDWVGTINAVDPGTGATTPTSLSVTITEDEFDETYKKLRIHNLDPVVINMSKVYTLKAVVDEEKTKITIANEQPVGYYDAYASYYVFYAFKVTSQGVEFSDSPVELLYDQDKETLTISSGYGTLFAYTDGNQYLGSVYAGGAVLSKKK